MRCDTCKDSGQPGYVVWPPGGDDYSTRFYKPCPDCNGQAIAHCCDGLQAQPGEAE